MTQVRQRNKSKESGRTGPGRGEAGTGIPTLFHLLHRCHEALSQEIQVETNAILELVIPIFNTCPVIPGVGYDDEGACSSSARGVPTRKALEGDQRAGRL